MIPNIKRQVAAIISLGTLLLSSSYLPARAESISQTRSIAKDVVSSYQKAEQELSPSLSVIYQVVDRLARANGMDDRLWQFAIVDRPEINADLSRSNRIRVFTGLLDRLAGDTSALACAIAHEMAHGVHHHRVIDIAQEKALIEQIQKEAEEEARRETAGALTQASVGGSLVSTAGSQRAQDLQQRIEKIKLKKTEELKQRLSQERWQQEFEADEMAYLYSVRAGFEPEGCLRLMEMLGHIPGTDADSDTHPAVPKRAENLKALMRLHLPASFATEGKARIDATQPIAYELSQDGMSLIIRNSQ